MKVEIDHKSGFCFGVVKAIDKAEGLLAQQDNVLCLGDIVHNRVEVSRLEQLGLHTITHDQISRDRGASTLLIRAHGEPPSTYALAEKMGLRVVDATCPVVAHLQKTVKAAWQQMKVVGGQVVILGKRGHAEVVGLTGQVDEDAIVVEAVQDLEQIDLYRPIYLLSQTTQSLELFEVIKDYILVNHSDSSQVTIHDTICRQVSNRNPHLREFATNYEVVIFVSGKKSSNGKALYEVCRSSNPHCYKIEDQKELHDEWFLGVESVGVCGATSTPKWLMEKIAREISDRYAGSL